MSRATCRTTRDNHERMIELRAEKVARIANDIPPIEVNGDDQGDLLTRRLGQHPRCDSRGGEGSAQATGSACRASTCDT